MKKNKKLYFLIIIIAIVGICLFYLIQNGIIFSKVTLSDSVLNLYVGDNKTITYKADDENKEVSWHSLDPSIATVDNNGKITARNSGKTQVYLEYGNTKRYCDIVVNDIPISSIKLNKNNLEMSIGELFKLEYSINPSNANNKSVTWHSSNENIISVDNGIIKANGLGEAIVEVKSSNGIVDKCNVIVNNKSVKELVVKEKNINLNIGSVYKLNVNIIPSDAVNSTLKYVSSNPSVVEVNEVGLLKANQSGTANITISSLNGISTVCNVNVSNNSIIDFKTISNNGKTIEITVNESDFSELVVNTSINNSIVNNKSTRTREKKYTIGIDNVGKWEIEAYLIYSDNKESNRIKKTYGIASISTIESGLYPALNSINFDEDNNILLFGSDFQGNESTNNTKSVLTQIDSKGIKPGLFAFLGDYSTNTSVSASNKGINSLNSITRSFNSFQNTGTIYIQGNHDPDATGGLSKTGEYEGNNYALFIINEDDYPRGNTGLERIKIVANKLDKYLSSMITYGVKKPVFVLTHVPLHYSSRKDNGYSPYIIDVLNKYGDKLDIIFMYGHNHSSDYDDCLGGSINYIAKGDTMKHYAYNANNKKVTITDQIKFTYLNAGYIGFIRNSNKQVNCNGVSVQSYNTPTLSLFTINERSILVEKYSSSGVFKSYTINRIN